VPTLLPLRRGKRPRPAPLLTGRTPERLSGLKTILSNLNVPAITLAQAVALSAAERDNLVVFVAGSPSSDALYATAHGLRDAGVHPILVIDALDNYPSLITTLQKLAEERFHTQSWVRWPVWSIAPCR